METRVCNFSRARKELKMKYITANEIAENLRSTDTWNAELCAALCEEAGMTAEWEAADGDTFWKCGRSRCRQAGSWDLPQVA